MAVGFTPLHEAAIADNAELCCALVELGADVNASRRMQRTPLCYAASGGDVDTIDFLTSIRYDSYDIDREKANGHMDACRALPILARKSTPVIHGASPLCAITARGRYIAR